MNITIIAGARPNFIKIAPLVHALDKHNSTEAGKAGKTIHYRIVHTGQHFDNNMSNTFFKQLNIPEPNINLNCGGGSQAEQTAAIMVEFEKDLISNPSDLVIVVGDVTSTMACSIVAKKLNTMVAHIEAGIRSWDLSMPEEINRMVTDCLADYFFTTTQLADINLKNSGANENNIFFVGNIMIDTLLVNRSRFIKPAIWDELGLVKGNYIVITLHRPANVDRGENIQNLLDSIIDVSRGIPVIFPVHPRTAKIIAGLQSNNENSKQSASGHTTPKNIKNIYLTEPTGYLEFNWLVENAKAVITDSGGITEETTVMGIPCITIRENTERPETITVGTNELIGSDPAALKPAMDKIFEGKWKKGGIPELWDGRTAERIVGILQDLFPE